MRIGLYQPDIPQNVGAILRLAACMDVSVELIEPLGFVLNDTKLRRAGMDYIERAALWRYPSWEAYLERRQPGRIVLLTTAAPDSYLDCAFLGDDCILAGSESAGVPEAVHARADLRLRIPMRSGTRSLNVAQAVAMVLGEALRQTAAGSVAPSPRESIAHA